MAPLKDLYAWTDRLTGIDADRAGRATQAASQWPIPELAQRLGRPRSVDDVVRVVLLAEAIESLVDRGAARSKMMAKLKDIRQFEATWAELRVAATLADHNDEDVHVELEAGASRGAHADLRLLSPEGAPSSIEIKSIGLSERELAFCQRMSPSLDRLIPPHGIATIHAPLHGQPPQLTPAWIEQQSREAARLAASVPHYPPGLSAAVIVAQEAEDAYARRAASRVLGAVRQLPRSDAGWVALLWTNGAPVQQVMQAVDWAAVPDHVNGIIFVGLVMAFPNRNLDGFIQIIERGVQPDGDRYIESSVSDELADVILRRTEASAGVRATLLRGRIRGKRRWLLRRDGIDRIPPFNVIMDRDPAHVTQGRRPSAFRR